MSDFVLDQKLISEAISKIEVATKQDAQEYVAKSGYDINTTVGQKMVAAYIEGCNAARKNGFSFFTDALSNHEASPTTDSAKKVWLRAFAEFYSGNRQQLKHIFSKPIK